MVSDSESVAIKGMDKLYEFEREPVSADKLQPAKHFAGVFAGEHVAGTEFVIGAMFVTWGASAKDIFVGLLLGNLMAVLTWTLICAPIAVRTRLTLYWYLRKVAGPVTTTIYNILNAVLFCILAGCMITVSASAVRIPFGIEEQTGWIPTDFRFVLVVVGVGSVVVALAILGFKKLAQFAEVCSPWLFLMFVGGAVAMLPGLASEVLGGQMGSWGSFWELANKGIWTGVAPEGQVKMTFWQVAAFAWICNLAMHGGLSDMALLRYAKKTSYGLFSAFGMFFGHYIAWICAGVMGAAAAFVAMEGVGNDAGGVAFKALGVSGIVAVIIAGWTTSNPTLYRAGLAFQAVTPGWPRWLVTLIAGTATTIIACSPFVFTELLNFVGYYGLLLMPVGAIVFVEHWIFPKIGLTQFWVSKKKLMFSWPALAAWVIAIAAALVLEQTGTLHLFFLFVPVWVLTSVLYIVFAAMAGAREKFPEDDIEATRVEQIVRDEDRSAAELYDFLDPKGKPDPVLWASAIISIACLLACLLLPIWVYRSGTADYEANFAKFKWLLIWPSLIYFIAGTVWAIKRNKEKA